jgi:transcriptional regulator NrdR family protein
LSEQPDGNLDRKQKLKQKRAERKKKKALLKEKLQNIIENTENSKPNDVEVEYVVANPLDELETADPIFKEFAEIFSKFSDEDLVKKKQQQQQQQQEQMEIEKQEDQKIGIHCHI